MIASTRPFLLAAASTPDRELLDQILAAPELRGAHHPSSTLSAMLEALQALIDALLGSQGAYGAAEIFRLVFFVLVGILLVWLLRKALHKLAPARAQEPERPHTSVRLESPEDHQRLAMDFHAREAFRDALRHHLLSAVSALERSGWASHGRHKTNRQYLDAIRRQGAPQELIHAFDALVTAHDPLWYGQAAITGPESQTAARLAENVRQAAVTHPRPPGGRRGILQVSSTITPETSA